MRWTLTNLAFFIGPLVNSYMRSDRRLQYSVYRGPFKSINEYYDAVLQLAEAELTDQLYLFLWQEKGFTTQQDAIFCAALPHTRETHSQFLDEEEWNQPIKEGIQNCWTRDILPAVRALREALPNINHPIPNDDVLHHHDISENNIMISPSSRIVAVLDLESVSFLPAIL